MLGGKIKFMKDKIKSSDFDRWVKESEEAAENMGKPILIIEKEILEKVVAKKAQNLIKQSGNVLVNRKRNFLKNFLSILGIILLVLSVLVFVTGTNEDGNPILNKIIEIKITHTLSNDTENWIDSRIKQIKGGDENGTESNNG